MTTQALDDGAAHGLVPAAKGRLAARRSLRFKKRSGLAALGLLLAAGAGWYGWHWWQVGRFIETTDDAYVGGNVTTLAPHVAGFVSQILVRDNQFVRAGQLLVTLDDRDYRARLVHAEAVVQREEAALSDLRAKYALQGSLIVEAQADLAAKRAASGFTREDRARYHALAVANFGSLQTYQKASAEDEKADSAVRSAAAKRDAATQQLAVLDSEIAEARAGLAAAEADRRTAELDLGYTRIRAPIDGYIGDRAAQIGAYTPIGTPLLAIVPADGLWVDANFKEDQLARMRPGETATIAADVQPGHSYRGRVVSLAPATGAVFSVIPPENATGNFTKIVQRVPVRIAVEAGDATLGLLRPGLSTTVRVDTRNLRDDRK